MNLQENELKEGACFIFNNAGDEKINYGFILINVMKEKEGNYIEFALIKIEKEGIIGIDDFKKGLLYTHQVYNPAGNKLGIFVYEFYQNTFQIINQFKYIGDLKLDKKKFIIVTATTAVPEPMFSKILKYCELARPNLDKTPLMKILED